MVYFRHGKVYFTGKHAQLIKMIAKWQHISEHKAMKLVLTVVVKRADEILEHRSNNNALHYKNRRRTD